MSERPFMQLYVSDFVGDTLQLSTEQIGAYMLMLMAMWNAGGTLPDDDVKLSRVVRMSLKKWRAISADLLTFFERANGEISHKRLTKELRKSLVKSEARAAAGALGGAAKALKTRGESVANDSHLPEHLPESRNQTEKAGAFSSENPSENAKHFSRRHAPEIARRSSGSSSESAAENARRSSGSSSKKPLAFARPPGWHQPKTHTDAANTIIEEILNHDSSRIAAGDEGAGRDVLMLPAIRAR
ncbi:YdaU family protein [Mesorhizobium sp.]|uniref:YdaU family protein n=1 Tax=Mesorhizobium sp. TaxID=1871066 RepID=UPI003BABF71F